MMRWCECALTSVGRITKASHTRTRVMWSEMNNRILGRRRRQPSRKRETKKGCGDQHTMEAAIRDSFHIWFNQFNTPSPPSLLLFVCPLCLTIVLCAKRKKEEKDVGLETHPPFSYCINEYKYLRARWQWRLTLNSDVAITLELFFLNAFPLHLHQATLRGVSQMKNVSFVIM